jgi:hypothetical protein
MRTNDFIPKSDPVFLIWIKTLIAYLQTKFSLWGVPKAAVTEVNDLIPPFDSALALAENPATRTKVTVQAKKTARKNLESKARILLKAYVTYNPAVTDADRDVMGLPIHKTTHTPVHEPTTVPEAEVKLPSPGVVEIHFRDAGSKRKAKPKGIHGAEIAWAILSAPTTDWNELNHSTFDMRTPQRLTFDGTERGKTVYFALRWENTRGEKGPWSEIMNTIIP